MGKAASSPMSRHGTPPAASDRPRDEGRLHVVAPMIDPFNPEVISLACGEQINQNLTLIALEVAIAMHGASQAADTPFRPK